MSNPKLALIPSGYKGGKVYSILPNNASGDFDFTRQSIGTRVRKDGLIEEAKTVGSITNELLYSEDYSQSQWSKIRSTISTDQTLAPDGTNTADKIIPTADNNTHRCDQVITLTNNAVYTLSFYVKEGGYNCIRASIGQSSLTFGSLASFNLNTETVSITGTVRDAQIQSIANNWYRCSITMDAGSTDRIVIGLGNNNSYSFAGDTTSGVFMWGAMVSEGALSDYIKTEGTTETKTVETFTDVPRLDWLNSNCPSLLLESQRTNLVLFSEQFSSTNWGSINTTITSDTVISPNGTMTANTLQRTSTSASYRSHNISKSASAITYTTSAFIKKGSDNYFSMRAQGSYPSRADFRFRFDTEQIYYTQAFSNFTILDYGVQNYSNGWYRLHFTYTSDAHTNLSITFSPRSTDGNIDNTDTSDNSFAYVWGAQTEVANYVSSYIKTETSTVTRLKDECLNGGDSDLFDITEGTFFVDVTPYDNEGANTTYILLSDGSTLNRIIFIFYGNFNQVRFFLSSNASGSTVNYLSHFQSISFNQKNKLAITFKKDELKCYANGSLVHTISSALVPINLESLDFSSSAQNLSFFEGKVHDIRIYDRVLTEAEAIELTT